MRKYICTHVHAYMLAFVCMYIQMCVHICMHTESINAQIYPDTPSAHFFWKIQ